MTTASDGIHVTRRVRLYAAIAVFGILALGIVFLPMSGEEGSGVESVTADKPPIPRTKVELTENKLIKQQALDLDATLKLSTAHRGVADAPER